MFTLACVDVHRIRDIDSEVSSVPFPEYCVVAVCKPYDKNASEGAPRFFRRYRLVLWLMNCVPKDVTDDVLQPWGVEFTPRKC